MRKLTGISASRGICIGPVFQFVRQELEIGESKVINPADELVQLNLAIQTAKEQISAIYQKALKESSNADAEIFQAHRMILDDPELINAVKTKINNEGKSAEKAMQEAGQSFADIMAAMDDEYFKARATDIMDVTNRVLRILLGVAESPTSELKEASIIVADDLTPSDTVMLDKTLVLGFCTARGSATSHTAILARGLGIPAVSGAGDEVLKEENGAQVILDGTSGTAIFGPDQAFIDEYRRRIKAANTIREEAMKHASEPATTKDGKTLEVVSNIGNVEGARSAVDNGAEGVGLLRTEFLDEQ